MNKLIITTVISIVLSIFPKTSFAQYIGAAAQPTRGLLIDKKILNSANNQYVDNLNIEQQTFLPEQDVFFRITVSNVIQTDLKNLTISDFLPPLLNFVSSSEGSCDTPCKIVSLKLNTLKVGESKTIDIRTKVKPDGQLPGNVSCQSNLARVTVDVNLIYEDTANFCVSKILPQAKVIPITGPTQTLPILILSALFLATGLTMRRIIKLEGR